MRNFEQDRDDGKELDAFRFPNANALGVLPRSSDSESTECNEPENVRDFDAFPSWVHTLPGVTDDSP